jgi:hypothetical protein
MDKNQQPKIRALRRLILAHITFQQVISACDFLISHDSDERAQFYGIFFSGICISYMRPFMSAEQIGPLPSVYNTFPQNPEHAQTHQDLKNGRNWAYAHNSPAQAAGLLADARRQEEQKKIRLVVHSEGISFNPPEVTWPKSRVHAIVRLCHFQIERVERELSELIKNLSGDKTYEDGEYIVGETFP